MVFFFCCLLVEVVSYTENSNTSDVVRDFSSAVIQLYFQRGNEPERVQKELLDGLEDATIYCHHCTASRHLVIGPTSDSRLN